MTTSTCEHRVDVLAALAGGRLMPTPELMAHVGACAVCGAAVARRLVGERLRQVADEAADEAAPERRSGMTANEAAFLLSGFGESPVAARAISDEDRRRLHEVASTLDAEAPDTAAVQRLASLGLHPPGSLGANEPARPPRTAAAGSSRWALIVAAAAAVLLAVGLGRFAPEEPTPVVPGEVSPERLGHGTQVGMELALGDRRCTTTRALHGPALGMGDALPCRWQASEETFTMNVRVEPDADARYVAVLARDEAGEVSVLYPGESAPASRLQTTTGRESERCAEDLCWLEGGRYDVAPGRLSVVAVFSTEPLPTGDMKAHWAPRRWTGPTRLVQRFELEVVP